MTDETKEKVSDKKEFDFTENQKDAITSKDKTLLISAGAGSGKTAVLTETIKQSLIEGADIDGILAVTYMKAAAASLKEKLYGAVLKAIADDPNNLALQRTLFKIQTAKISTIHSFCFDLIKNNFSTLGLSPVLRITDDAEKSILLSKALETLTDELFAKDDKDLIMLCDEFGDNKGFDSFNKIIISVYLKYSVLPFWKKSVETEIRAKEKEFEVIKNNFSGSDEFKEFKSRMLSLENHLNAICEEWTNMLSCVPEAQGFHFEGIENCRKKITDFFAFAEDDSVTYEQIRAGLACLTFESAKTKGLPYDVSEKYKAYKKALTKPLSDLGKSLCEEPQIISEYEKAIAINKAFFGFICRLDEKYAEEKRKIGALDFADLEQKTLELLGTYNEDGILRTELCREIQKSFDRIYIDEYQDVNPLQDAIFKLISKDNNRFMVGDVKQAIYGFRGASADIFLRYLGTYPHIAEADKTKSKTAKVYLPENFRSSEPIINFVNYLFGQLYTPENVAASYEDEKLIFGGKEKSTYPVTVKVFDDSADGLHTGMENEASYVASEISRLVNKTDENGKKYAYKDIAILLRSVTTAKEYIKEFEKRGIPYSIEKNEEFLFEPEILLALSVLKIINNPQSDVSLIGALRSPIYRFTADDIYKVKLHYGCMSLFSCVKRASNDYKRKAFPKKYRSDKPISEISARHKIFSLRRTVKGAVPNVDFDLKKKCADFIVSYEELIAPGFESSGSALIINMFEKTGIVALCSAEENGDIKRARLYRLYEYALDFERSSFKGLSMFLDHIEEIASKYDSGINVDNDASECVKITTIHKSKGLDYPVCFVSSLGNGFNDRDMKERVSVGGNGYVYYKAKHDDGINYGKTFPYINQMARVKNSFLKEELRCFYVALTRAKEKLYLTGKRKGCAQDKNEELDFAAAKSFMDWVYPLTKGKEELFFDFSTSDVFSAVESFAPETKTEAKDGGENVCAESPYSDSRFAEALEFSYKYNGSTIPAKAAVSELRKGLLEDDEYTKSISGKTAASVPEFAKKSEDSAVIGTATHAFMQFADFENVKANGVKSEAERLVKIKMLSAEDISLIDIEAIETFFKSDLYGKMKKSANLYREKRFNIIDDFAESGEKVMIQGVIDCFFENPDGTYTVVDYKTDRIKRGEENKLIDRHSFQVNYYRRAVSEMTGKTVSSAILWSFALGKEIEVTEQ